ncbi:MAG: choice-of-anchor D domain-containing protein, partial [Planctomycetes bacterium]|nr:choice-of-anchor D domain-containing protein [Planctomycetota bacterium]
MRNLRHYALLVIALITISTLTSCDARITSLLVSPKTYDYKIVNLGESKQYFFRVMNKANENFIITRYTLIGVADSDYRIISGAITPMLLQGGKAIILTIEFKPTAAGIRSSKLLISHNGANFVNEIFLTGVGLPVPRLKVNDYEFDFGVVYVNRLKTHDFEFENYGTADVVISSISVDGSHSSLYSFPNGTNTPIVINPAEITPVTLGFTPLTDGSFPCNLKVFHNAIDLVNPLVFPIDAEGVTYAPEIDVDRISPWDFGLAPVGYPAIQDIKITSTGIDQLMITNVSTLSGSVFKIMSKKDKNGANVNLPDMFNNGDYVVIRIEFSPIATAIYDDTLRIQHDGINESIPLDIELDGEGKVPVIQNFAYTGSAQQFV